MAPIIENSLGITENGLVIPRGRAGLAPMEIPLKAIHDIEARIPEIQRSTPTTLPDLVTQFTIGILKMSSIMAMVDLEVRDAKRTLDHARAVANLERSEAVLKAKSVKSSADTRDAAITLDPDVQTARERLDALTAAQYFLTGKNNAIEMAYHGAKKICDIFIRTPSSPNYGGGKDE